MCRLVAFASSLDHIGLFARTVKDAATVLEVIAGRDPLDSTSAEAPVPNFSAHVNGDIRGMKLGVPVEYMKHATGETADLINQARFRRPVQQDHSCVAGQPKCPLGDQPGSDQTHHRIQPCPAQEFTGEEGHDRQHRGGGVGQNMDVSSPQVQVVPVPVIVTVAIGMRVRLLVA